MSLAVQQDGPRTGGSGSTEQRSDGRGRGLFPNDASLLRLVRAVLMEVSEDWETNRTDPTMGPAGPARLLLVAFLMEVLPCKLSERFFLHAMPEGHG